MRSGPGDRSSLSTACASSLVRTSRQSSFARLLRSVERDARDGRFASRQIVGCRVTEQECPCALEQNGVGRSGDRFFIERASVAHRLVPIVR